jgi:sugar phosphate isomerase/epimerase
MAKMIAFLQMEFGISTLCLGSEPATVDSLEKIRKSGFSRLELHANRPNFEYHNKALMRSVARWFAENELPSPSLHLPFEEELQPGLKRPVSVLAALPLERQAALDEIKRCLELLEHLNVAYVVLHLGVPGQQFHPVAFDYAYAAIVMIQSFSGARVMVENIDNEIAVPRRIEEFAAAAQLQNVGICYDIGHGDVPDAFVTPASAFHINDNDGMSDLHLWPFEGKTSWPAFAGRLVESGLELPLILEAHDSRLERGVDSMHRLGDLIDEARNSIEEFRLKYKLPFTNPEEN